MKQIEMSKKFKVEFNKPEFNNVWEFRRGKSAAFAYGNQTCVAMLVGGVIQDVFDTRYDHDVMSDFGKWCVDYLKSNLNPEYEPKIVEVA